MNIHPTVKEAASIFINAGKQVYLVGGAVRDILRRGRANDWDLATDAKPEEVIELFSRPKGGRTAGNKNKIRSFVIPTGIKHGTVTLHYRDLKMEVTTFRSESGYSNFRHPDRVSFGVSMEEDLSRRDFTMNAAAYKLPKGPLVDPFDGRGDIKNSLIRCVGNPLERFSEDALRPMRAMRFASQLNFNVDQNLLDAIPAVLPLTKMVAVERIRDEMDKILVTDKPSIALGLMEKTGLLELLIPELAACRGVKQDRVNNSGYHKFDVLDHSLLGSDYASIDRTYYEGGNPLHVRLAVLYHDIGKATTAEPDGHGGWTFHGHDRESSKIARKILRRFKYPNALIEKVCILIDEHMFNYQENWSDAAVRRFIIRSGEENLRDLYSLRRADAFGTTGIEPSSSFLLPMMNRMEKILSEKKALSLKDLAVSGKDLIKIGISPGKYMGIILEELLNTVIEDPELNTMEKLLEIAEKINNRYKNN